MPQVILGVDRANVTFGPTVTTIDARADVVARVTAARSQAREFMAPRVLGASPSCSPEIRLLPGGRGQCAACGGYYVP